MLIYRNDQSIKLFTCNKYDDEHVDYDHHHLADEMHPTDCKNGAADIYLKNSIFVANLSQHLNNTELAWALYALFRPFGMLRSIKASRDTLGRPFGFIEFYGEEACDLALGQNLILELAGRPLRMERARRQLKLLLKYTGREDVMEQRRRLENFLTGQRMSLQQDAMGLSAIVRLDKAEVAQELYQKCCKMFSEEHGWKVSWMNGDESGVSSIRSSGLVQLVFTPDGTASIQLDAPFLPYYSPSPEPILLFNQKVLTL